MNFTTKIIIVFVAIVAVVLAVTYFNSGSNNKVNYDQFAQCLTSKGMKLYGAFWCPHCQDQKALFGSSISYITYVECSNSDKSENAVCQSAGIVGYPTWQLPDGSKHEGQLTLQELAVLSGCTLPQT